MTIKKLFKTESEFLDYAWSFISFDENEIWREEDLTILQPFFDYRDGLMSPEVKRGFDLWIKRRDEYADELFNIRDALSNHDRYDLYNFFFLKEPRKDCWDYNENGEDIDEEGNVLENDETRENLKFISDIDIQFPLIFIGWVDSGFTRAGEEKVMFSDWVSLDDFEDKN